MTAIALVGWAALSLPWSLLLGLLCAGGDVDAELLGENL